MKRAFLYGSAGVAALLALVAAVPLLVPASIYKSEIESAVSSATGRKFSIAGPLHFTLFPQPTIRADRVSLAGIPGGQAPFVATADDIKFGIHLWPLLSGRIELTRIVLDKAAIALEVTADRRANWILNRAQKVRSGDPGARFSIAPRFSGIEIVQGRVTYANTRSGIKYSFKNIDCSVDLTGIDQPVIATGTFDLLSRTTSFDMRVTTLRPLLSARNGRVEVSLNSGTFRTEFSGTITPEGHVYGHLSAEMESLRDTATWLGAHMPDSGGFGKFSFESMIEGDHRGAALKKLSATLDGMHLGGDLRLALDSPLPFVEGALLVDRLDLNPYMAHRTRRKAARHKKRTDEWSDEPISLDILKKANAVLTLDAASLNVRNLKLGTTTLHVGLRDGKLDARLFPMSLYGGKGHAMLTIDTNRSAPTFHSNLEVDNVALKPFLTDTIGVEQIEGIGTIRLEMTSQGTNPFTIMHRLSGKGSILFRDGRVRGVDLGEVARAAQRILGDATLPDSFTSFASISGSFTAANGVLVSRDFQLDGQVLRMTGSGTVDMGARNIDFRIVPQATAVIAKRKLSLGVPFFIRGPWTHIRYTPDFTDILKGVLNNLESGKAPFKGLFGAPKTDTSITPRKKHKSIGDALKNMLGIH